MAGDTIGVISPSAGSANQFPHRVERGINFLTSKGFRIKVAPHALKKTGATAGTAKERAEDLHSMFADPAVRAIFTTIGGKHCIEILPFIDWNVIKANPKILVGYSDTTILQLAIYEKTKLVTFYGPNLMVQLGEFPQTLDYTWESLTQAVMTAAPLGALSPSTSWTDEFLDWRTKADLTRARRLRLNTGWTWLRQGVASGPLLGGCLSPLMRLADSDFFPAFSASVLFWEIPESDDLITGLPLDEVQKQIARLVERRALEGITGMVIGRPYGYTSDQTEALKVFISNMLPEGNYPILFGVDVGHTDPMMTLPIGCSAELCSFKERFSVIEPAVI